MSYLLVFTRQARESYAAIQSQLIERFGYAILEKFEQKTVKTIDSILKSPLMFKAVDDNPNIRKGLIHKNCSIIYKVKTNEIEILFFWDNRQEPIL